MKTFKHFFAALLLLCSTVATAQTVVVDGINYEVVAKAKEAVVIAGETEYSGHVVIPAAIEYNGVTYSVTGIGDDAFLHNTDLTGIEIPNSVISIRAYAFYGCTRLANIEIPNSVTSIGKFAFSDCTGLTRIVIPGSVTSIGISAFSVCTGLTSIEIPNSVARINEHAFQSCTGLTNIEIPNSVTSIGNYAFENCTGLTRIVIPNSVTSIGEWAFSHCSGLTSIEIPSSVTYIGNEAFANCIALENVYCYAGYVSDINESAFDGSYPEYINLYVRPEALDSYKTTEPWSCLGNILPMSFDLTVTAAGYATLYLGYAAEIPAGVEVYTANAVEDDRLKMQPVEGVIPANTGVIVKAAAGTYTFNNADDAVAAIEGNLFKGSLKDETVKVASGKAAYVLSMVDGEVGMYRAELTGHSFLNNANKAYLLLDSNNLGVYDDEWDTSAGGQLSNGYRFDFGGITGIENVKGESGEVKAIYDLSGRAVENPSKGLYIINGKKVLVK